MENTIIYLVGFSGTGKYTIAKEIAAQSGARIVDNQHMNNPIFGVIRQDGMTPLPETVWDRVFAIRAAVFETIATLSPEDWSFVVTHDHNGEHSEIAYLHQILSAAARRNSRFLPVRLTCEIEELCRRVVVPERRQRMKSVNAKQVRRRATRGGVPDLGHPNTLTLDVTALAPADAARQIISRAASLPPWPQGSPG